MRWIGSLLAMSVGLFGAASVAHDSVAQTTDTPSKSGTRLITLGTLAGPPPRPHWGQSSNLLIVNGTLYVIDAGDGAARESQRSGSTSEMSERYSSHTIMTITQRGSAR
jgi:hypothetical protein